MTNNEKIKQLEKQNEEIQATLKDLLDHKEMNMKKWNRLVQDMQTIQRFIEHSSNLNRKQDEINQIILNIAERLDN